MTLRRRVLGVAAAGLGVAAAGTAFGVVRQRRAIVRRPAPGDLVPLGSLRGEPRTVVAEDGVPLHVEVDEGGDPGDPTLVFVHGYALNLDCWHFQRASFRGRFRSVYYDQRSHGRSGRAPDGHATIEHLGDDLAQVLGQVVPEGRVVLVGHSMGGMTIMALAEQHPELFGERVAGLALVATTAGGLSPHRVLLPVLPDGIGGELAQRLVAGLARSSRTVDGLRRVGKDLALVATDLFAFGDEVPSSYVEFVDAMLAGTPFEVLAEFFGNFSDLDKFAVLEAFERVPTTIVCGTADRLTPVEHSEKLHRLVAGSRYVACEGAGHMVILERHRDVDAALADLVVAARAHVPSEDA